MTEAHLFDLSHQEISIPELEKSLPASLLKHCQHYHLEDDYRNSLFAWNKIAKHYALSQNVLLSFTHYGKPEIKGIHFNLSHSKDCVAIVYGDKECGMDVQFVDSQKKYLDYADKLLTKREYQEFLLSKEQNRTFVQLWTHKEAYYKRIGKGIDVHKLKEEFLDPYRKEGFISDKNNCLYAYTVSSEEEEISLSLE